jgi:hypothetical protein
MKEIAFCFIFSCLFSIVNAFSDTLTIMYSVKEHYENAFDYNTKHYKFILFDKGTDSKQILMYALDNATEPFSKKMKLVEQFCISKESYLGFRHNLFQLLNMPGTQDKSLDAAVISTGPNGMIFNCFGPPSEIIARIYVKTLGDTEYFGFDQKNKGEMEKMNRVEQLLKDVLRLEK